MDVFDRAVELEMDWELEQAETLLANEMEPDDPRHLLMMLRVLLKQGKLIQAESLADSLTNPTALAHPAYMYMTGLVKLHRGKVDEALLFADRLYQTGTEASDSVRLSQAHHLKGRLYFNQGRFESALAHQKKSQQIASAINYRKMEADALRQLGVLSWYGLDHTTAIETYFNSALEIYAEINDKSGEATTLSNIGLLEAELGNRQDGVSKNIRAFHIRQTIGDRLGLADSYYFLGNLISISGLDAFFPYIMYHKSLEISQDAGYQWGAGVALRALQSLDYSGFRPLVYLDGSTESLLQQSGVNHLYHWQEKARGAYYNKDFDNAAIYALRQIDHLKDKDYKSGLIHAHRVAGKAFIGKKDFERAHHHLETAGRLIGETGFHFTQPVVDYHRAIALYHIGKKEEAFPLLAESIELMEQRYRSNLDEKPDDLLWETNYLNFLNLRSDMYKTYIDWLSDKPDNTAVFEAIEREKSTLFWWMQVLKGRNGSFGPSTKTLELFRAFGAYTENPDDADAFDKLFSIIESGFDDNPFHADARPQRLPLINGMKVYDLTERLQSALGLDEVFVHYFITDDKAVASITGKHGHQALVLPVSVQELKSVAGIYPDLIKRGRHDPADTLWKAASKNLYRYLILPLENSGIIPQNARLLISPHDVLQRLPFQSLLSVDGAGNETFFVEKYTVSILDVAVNIVLNGLPEPRAYTRAAAFAPAPKTLIHTKEETEAVRLSGISQALVFSGRRATSANFNIALQRYDIVHFAGHIMVNPYFPYASGIFFSDRQSSLLEILGSRISSKLVVLSACESGNILTGSNVSVSSSGFARALLLAGADDVISTYWVVEDASTATLMKLFYKELDNALHQSGPTANPASEALRRTQLAYLSDGSSDKHIHPFYWAGFSHTGNR